MTGNSDAIRLDMIRDCFEGAIPSSLATASLSGVPNIVYISQVQYVDAEHIALTFQFFNKTHHNIHENPHAVLRVVNPFTGNAYRLQLRYLHTEISGALFEKMRAKLAGIASHTGMSGVFKLLGSDIYKVESITALSHHSYSFKPVKPAGLPRLRQAAARISQCEELSNLVDTCLALLANHFTVSHAMFLVLDETGNRLFTCGSLGYKDAGIGSEILLGEGVIGVAAREATAIRISHMTSEYAYGNAIRQSAEALGQELETAIPLPGLAESRSQLALPLVNSGQTLGVIYVESEQDLAFDYDDEDLLETFAQLVAAQMQLVIANKPRELSTDPNLLDNGTREEPVDDIADCSNADSDTPTGEPVTVRFFTADQSVFLGDDYLIKGVAGAIFWLLVQEYCSQGRARFSNRELRLNSCLRLPGIADNLEARLTLLQKRLVERDACVQMHKCGRGRFSIHVKAPLIPVAI
jgi:adenylate cyclase